MAAYIALLRGINVSGQKIIPMAALAKMFVKLGFKDAKTFIQSGNVVFSAPAKDAGKFGKAIAAGIQMEFGFEVPVVIRSLDEMRAALSGNPYGKKQLAEKERLYICYLDAAPGKGAISELEAIADDDDEVKVKGMQVYLMIRNGYGDSVFNNNFVEKKLGVRATTRNLATSQKLIALAEAL